MFLQSQHCAIYLNELPEQSHKQYGFLTCMSACHILTSMHSSRSPFTKHRGLQCLPPTTQQKLNVFEINSPISIWVQKNGSSKHRPIETRCWLIKPDVHVTGQLKQSVLFLFKIWSAVDLKECIRFCYLSGHKKSFLYWRAGTSLKLEIT